LRQYLGHTESGDPAKDFAEGLGRFKGFVDQYKDQPGLLGPMLQARGYDKLGIGTEQARIVQGMSAEEVAELGRGYRGDVAGRLGLPPDVARKWTDFSNQMERAGREIETVFAKGTIKLAKPLEHLSDSFIHLTENLLKDGTPIAGWIKDLGKGIENFADELGSGAVQAKAAEIGKDIADTIKLFDAILTKAPGGVAVLLGTGLAARYGGGAAVAIGAGLARSRALGAIGRMGAGVAGTVLGPAGFVAIGPLVGSTTPANQGENEQDRQRRYHQGPYAGRPSMPRGVFPEMVPAKPGGLSDKSAIWMGKGGASGYGVGTPAPLGFGAGRHPDVAYVDRRLNEITAAAAQHLPPGYRAVINEGYNASGHVSRSQHHIRGRGALDIAIIGPDGKVIPNEGGDPTGAYHRFARAAYGEMLARYPELEGQFAWGGAFGASHKNSAQDLMHFDIGGERGSYLENRLSRMGPPPVEPRHMATRKFGHPHGMGHHPATIGRAQKTVTVEDHTGGLVMVVPH